MTSRGELLQRMRELWQQAQVLGDPTLLAELRALLRDEDKKPAAADGFWHGIAGTSPPMLALRPLLERFAATSAPVLIYGESGTGKELIARALHDLSPRRAQPFVSENCAAIPETLLESVLFGHVRGSFTGAVRDHAGHFAAAHKGTLFLDEIGDMPLAMQTKLLRVLQEGEVRPVGGNEVRKVDVRVVAATNRDLEQLVGAGKFRQDLLYRLNVLQVRLPPLRERGDDVLLLARLFLQKAAAAGARSLSLGRDAEAILRQARWPGNVRQLQNEMQRVAALADGPVVTAADLSKDL
jgi:transcriptional regulator with GAF, ATPase, and Fis domain